MGLRVGRVGWEDLGCLYVEEAVRGEEGWLGEGTQRRPVCGDRRRVSCCVGGGMQCTSTREEYVGCSGPPRIVYCNGSTTCSMGTVLSPSAECTGGCKSGRDRGQGWFNILYNPLMVYSACPNVYNKNIKTLIRKLKDIFCLKPYFRGPRSLAPYLFVRHGLSNLIRHVDK